MKTTGIFTVHRYEIPCKYNEPILLLPFGDVHRSANLCHEEKWFEWLEWAKAQDNAYFLGMGDYDDLSSTSERRLIQNADLHDSTKYTLDELYRKTTDRLYKEISFMKGRIIGMIEGNHYCNLQSGITTTQYLCDKLDCKYLGVSSFIRLGLQITKTHSNSVDIWAHHGLSGGRTLGTSVNKLENMTKAAEADIYLMGHDHKKSVQMLSRLGLSKSQHGLRILNRKTVMARTGSFLRGYVPGEASYVADGAYPPLDLGTIAITITPRRRHETVYTNNKRKEVFENYVDINGSL